MQKSDQVGILMKYSFQKEHWRGKIIEFLKHDEQFSVKPIQKQYSPCEHFHFIFILFNFIANISIQFWKIKLNK